MDVLSEQEQRLIDAYWRGANYLSVGQIYLYDNPLLKEPLTKEHIKPRLLGHWAAAESTRCVDDANGLGHIFQDAADLHVVSQIQEITLEIQVNSGKRFIGVAPFPTSPPPWSQASGPL